MRRIQAISILILAILALSGSCFAATGIQAKTGNILLDGKPFFPIGVYAAGSDLPAGIDPGSLKDLGFNSVVFGKKPSDGAISKVEKAGLAPLEIPKGLPITKIDDASKFESLPVYQRPTPKFFLINVSEDTLENAAARAVIDGGKGVLYLADRLPSADTLKKVNSELVLMSTIALAPFPVEHLLIAEDRLQAMYKEVDGKRYILTANITHKPQSLYIYVPDPPTEPSMIIGRKELVLAEKMYFQCGFEKYGILMFSWPVERK